jgi:hypothetical protein
LPGDSPAGGTPTGAPGDNESLEKLLEGLNLDFEAIDEKNDRYPLPSGTPGQPGSTPAENQTPVQGESAPAPGTTASPPADEPPAQRAAPPVQDSAPTESSGDSGATPQSENASADADQPE